MNFEEMLDYLTGYTVEEFQPSEPETKVEERPYVRHVSVVPLNLKKAQVFIDCSGSTAGFNYKSPLERVLKALKLPSHFNTAFWDHKCARPTRNSVENIIRTFLPNGSTEPSTVIPHLEEDAVTVVITDGEIAHSEMESMKLKIETSFKGKKLQTLVCIIISDDPSIRENLNLYAPFFQLTSNILIASIGSRDEAAKLLPEGKRGAFANATSLDLSQISTGEMKRGNDVVVFNDNGVWYEFDIFRCSRDAREWKDERDLSKLPRKYITSIKRVLSLASEPLQKSWNELMSRCDSLYKGENPKFVRELEELRRISDAGTDSKNFRETLKREMQGARRKKELEDLLSAESPYKAARVHNIFERGVAITPMQLRESTIATQVAKAVTSDLKTIWSTLPLAVGECDIYSNVGPLFVGVNSFAHFQTFLRSPLPPDVFAVYRALEAQKKDQIVFSSAIILDTASEWQFAKPQPSNFLVDGKIFGGRGPVALMPKIQDLDCFRAIQHIQASDTKTEALQRSSTQLGRMYLRNALLYILSGDPAHSVHLADVFLVFVFHATRPGHPMREHKDMLKSWLFTILNNEFPYTVYVDMEANLEKTSPLSLNDGTKLLMFAALFGRPEHTKFILVRMVIFLMMSKMDGKATAALKTRERKDLGEIQTEIAKIKDRLSKIKGLNSFESVAKRIGITTLAISYDEFTRRAGLNFGFTGNYIDFEVLDMPVLELHILRFLKIGQTTHCPTGCVAITPFVRQQTIHALIGATMRPELGGGRFEQIRSAITSYMSDDRKNSWYMMEYYQADFDKLVEEEEKLKGKLHDLINRLKEKEVEFKQLIRDSNQGSSTVVAAIERANSFHNLYKWMHNSTDNKDATLIQSISDFAPFFQDFTILHRFIVLKAREFKDGKPLVFTESDKVLIHRTS